MGKMNKVSPGMRFFVSRMFPIPFILVGIVTLYLGVKGVYLAKESTMWPTADGTIQSSTVKYSSSSRKGGGSSHAEVLYQFIVDGRNYSGNTVAFGDYSGGSSHAQNIVNRYPKDSVVKVYFLTGAPDTCVLEPGLRLQTWAAPVFGIIFLTAGSLMAVFIPRGIKSEMEKSDT